MLYILRSLLLIFAVCNSAVILNDHECHVFSDSFCNIGYNKTRLPNSLGHTTVKDALLQLQTFTSLIQYGCSKVLKEFLCLTYLPVCDKSNVAIRPCRQLCERSRENCEPVLKEFAYPWPRALDCSELHDVNEPGLCSGAASLKSSAKSRSALFTTTVTPPSSSTYSPSPPPGKCHPSVPVPKQCHMSYQTAALKQKSSISAMSQLLSYNTGGKAMNYFLCSVYFPPCDERVGRIPPCRHVCKAAKRETLANTMNQYKKWPSRFDCEQYPEKANEGVLSMCLDFHSVKTVVANKTRGINFRKFLSLFRKSIGKISKDLSGMYDLLPKP